MLEKMTRNMLTFYQSRTAQENNNMTNSKVLFNRLQKHITFDLIIINEMLQPTQSLSLNIS